MGSGIRKCVAAGKDVQDGRIETILNISCLWIWEVSCPSCVLHENESTRSLDLA